MRSRFKLEMRPVFVSPLHRFRRDLNIAEKKLMPIQLQDDIYVSALFQQLKDDNMSAKSAFYIEALIMKKKGRFL